MSGGEVISGICICIGDAAVLLHVGCKSRNSLQPTKQKDFQTTRCHPATDRQEQMPQLTTEQLQRWEEDGYLVVPDFYSPAETGEMLAQARKLLADFDPTKHPLVCPKADQYCTLTMLNLPRVLVAFMGSTTGKKDLSNTTDPLHHRS